VVPPRSLLQADIQAASPAQRGKLEADLKLAESYLAEVRALKPALPTIAFEQTMKLYRRDREIHLLHLGRAHTEGDVFVYLPKEKVVITGDAMIGWTPYMGDGYPEDWAGRSIGWLSSTSPTSSWGMAT
jgi:glyoxylase-like metal-dependent hydrolase (beta-lactamase superfamily II)